MKAIKRDDHETLLARFNRVKDQHSKGQNWLDACKAEGTYFGWYRKFGLDNGLLEPGQARPRKVNAIKAKMRRAAFTVKREPQTYVVKHEENDEIIFLKCKPEHLEALKVVIGG